MAGDILVAIIGGGVVGCAVAKDLSVSFDDVFLFEKNPGITKGENQSSRNSGVIHSGIYYDQETRPLKARLCVEGNMLLYKFCREHRVPVKRTGKLLIATGSYEEDILNVYLEMAKKNHITGVKIISRSEVRNLEPNVSAKSALYIPSSGIVDPITLVYRLHTIASKNAVQSMSNTEVVGIAAENDRARLTLMYRDGRIDEVVARVVINAGGIEADRLVKLYNPDSPYELDPIKGESYKFFGHKRPDLSIRGMNIYPTPDYVITPDGKHFTVGIHLTPTFEDLSSFPPVLGSTVTVGPRLIPVADRDSWRGTVSKPEFFVEKVSPFFKGLKKMIFFGTRKVFRQG